LGALSYEALLLAALALVAGFLLLPFASPTRTAALTIPPTLVRAMTFCALAAGAAIYYAWFWSEGRRTLPQKTWRLRLVSIDGSELARATALVRYAAGWIGPLAALAMYAALRPAGLGRYAALLLLANYAWALVDPERQFLHDRLAATRVVDDDASSIHAQ
jgi:uncharacterized RDD family membrane protein YckC